MKGPLSEGTLPRILRGIYVGRKTGLLHVTRGADRGSVCFINGTIVYGDTTVKECHMGETLVRHGRLSQWDLDRALEVVTLTGKRLGEVLLDLGILDADGVEEALALQVREVLLCIFSWSEGSYAFEEENPEAFRGYDRPLKLSTGEVILDAVWSVQDADVVRYALGDVERVLVLSSDPLLRFQRITLTPTDGYILSRVDGTLSARQILGIAPVSPEEAHRSLLGLLCTGMVEYASEPARAEERPPAESFRREILEAHEALATRTHFEVLGVPPDASDADVKAAYFRLARRFHPDAHHDPALADLRGKLDALFYRLNDAFHVLSHSESRAQYQARITRGAAAVPEAPPEPAPVAAVGMLQVEDLVQKAEERLAENKHWEAVALLGEAIPVAQGRLRQRARVMLARAYLCKPELSKQAEKELQTVVQEDPSQAEAYFLLGALYRQGGLNARAGAMLRKALELKPRHKGALAELALLPPETPQEPGFLKKLLR